MPDGSRREFLRFGLSAFGAMSLPALYHARAAAPGGSGGRTAVIIVWLRGGCSRDTVRRSSLVPSPAWSVNMVPPLVVLSLRGQPRQGRGLGRHRRVTSA